MYRFNNYFRQITACTIKRQFTTCPSGSRITPTGVVKTKPAVLSKMIKTVDWFANINVTSNVPVSISSVDMFRFSPNTFISELMGGCKCQKPSCEIEIHISTDRKILNIEVTKKHDNDYNLCQLFVPRQADVTVDSKSPVKISYMMCQNIYITAESIMTHAITAQKEIFLHSLGGNITCTRMLMGNTVNIETKKQGNIHLAASIGNDLYCKTDRGNLRAHCCYYASSIFITNWGNMVLKNVHKKSQVYILDAGNIIMTGVRGNLYLCANKCNSLDLQLSFIHGESVVKCADAKEAKIAMSDKFEKQIDLDITANPIIVDKTYQRFARFVKDKKHLVLNQKNKNQIDKLIVDIKGPLTISQLTWVERVIRFIRTHNLYTYPF